MKYRVENDLGGEVLVYRPTQEESERMLADMARRDAVKPPRKAESSGVCDCCNRALSGSEMRRKSWAGLLLGLCSHCALDAKPTRRRGASVPRWYIEE